MTRTLAATHDMRAWATQTWLTLGAAVLAASMLHAGARAAESAGIITPLAQHPSPVVEAVRARMAPQPEVVQVTVWEGADIDGDGSADFANPTGKAPRGHDAYGEGEFGASRDGGARRHEGVDYVAEAGQQVVAPISGFVSKIGLAYAGDSRLKFVEITNPAIGYVARVFYVDPTVAVGEAVRLGAVIGSAHGLQAKYPGGMTDHVHLELAGPNQRKIDCANLITARLETRTAFAD